MTFESGLFVVQILLNGWVGHLVIAHISKDGNCPWWQKGLGLCVAPFVGLVTGGIIGIYDPGDPTHTLDFMFAALVGATWGLSQKASNDKNPV